MRANVVTLSILGLACAAAGCAQAPEQQAPSVGVISDGVTVESSDGCPSGQWCCIGLQGQFCADCLSTPCFEPQPVTCARYGAIPALGC